jgi:hypothetical protein
VCLRIRVSHTHGGLTPAAHDTSFVIHRALFAAPCKRDREANHGGLTPAALVNVTPAARLRASQKSFFMLADVRIAIQERGA